MPIGAFKLNSIAKYIAAVITGRSAVTVTTNGNAQVSTTQSKFGGASGTFDGSGDYLQPATSTDLRTWNNSTTGYTVECWFNPNSFTIGGSPSNYPLIVGNMNQGGDTNLWSFGPASSTTLVFYYFNGAQQRLSATVSTMSTGTWYHIAFTYSTSGTMTIWKDGVSVATGSVAGTPQFNASAGLFVIGQVNNVGYNGYLDELRISKTARYSSTFTPATTPFVNDSNTLLLLHMNGTSGSTSFPDDAGSRSRQGISIVGSPTISTAQSKIGSSSYYQPGTATNYAVVGNNSTLDLSDFTIEFWWYNTGNLPNGGGLTPFINSNVLFYIGWNSGYVYDVYAGGSKVSLSYSVSLSQNTWYHVAFQRSGSTITVWHNGSQVTSGSGYTGTLGSTWDIGKYSSGYFWQGYLDEIRVSKVARYSSTFTPSTTAFTNDSDTVMLLHCEGTNGSTAVLDDNA